jgi:hypothetical protein
MDSNVILIDCESDLSVDTDMYSMRQNRSGRMIVHNNKILILVCFHNISSTGYGYVWYEFGVFLQMDTDGNNRKIVTFDEVNTEEEIVDIGYNFVNDKIMLLGMHKINTFQYSYSMYEYSYNDTDSTYTFYARYDYDNSANGLGDNEFDHSYHFKAYGFIHKFDGNIAYYPIVHVNCLHNNILSSHLYKRIYNYRTEENASEILKKIDLGYIDMPSLSDIAIDGRYLWLLSIGNYDRATERRYYNLMKVRPL